MTKAPETEAWREEKKGKAQKFQDVPKERILTTELSQELPPMKSPLLNTTLGEMAKEK